MKMNRNVSSAALCLLLSSSTLFAADGAWNIDSNGQWSVASNWLELAVPGGVGSSVIFTNGVTAPRVVEVDAPVTVGSLRFSSPANNNWKLVGNGPLNLDNGTAVPILQSTVNQRVEIFTPITGSKGFLQQSAGDLEFSGSNSGLIGIQELRNNTVFHTMSKSADSTDALVENFFPTSGVIMAGARLELYGRKNASAVMSDWITTAGSATLIASNGVSSASLAPGQSVTGTGIPAHAFVKTIIDNTTLVLSAAAEQSVTSTLTFASASFNSKQLLQRVRTDTENTFRVLKNGGNSFEVEIENLHGRDDLLVQNSDGVLKVAGQRNHRASIKLESGTLAVAPKTVSRQPAVNPAFHVDASAASTLTMNGAKVAEWRDLNNNGWSAKSPDVGTQPTLLANGLNGLPVIDYGPWGTSPYMEWYTNAVKTEMTTIRTVFIVMGSQQGGGYLLGSATATHFHRGSNRDNGFNPGETSSKIIGVAWGNVNTGWSGLFTDSNLKVNIDGVPASPHDSFSGGYQLISCRATVNAQAGLFACDRPVTQPGRRGGQRLAEVIIYTRELSELERIQTEEYLTAKWFPERWDLNGGAPRLNDLTSSGARVMNTPETGVVTLRKLQGYGTLTKNGESALQIDDAQDFLGTVAVNGGDLKFDVAKMPSAPASNAYFHVDASVTNSFVLNGSGGVMTWNDVRGNGRSASVTAGYSNPTLLNNGLNGKPIVDFGAIGSWQSLMWNQTNNAIRAAFLVFESKSNEAFLLGHTVEPIYDFHRDGARIYNYQYSSRAPMCGLNTINGHAVLGKDAIMPVGFNVIAVQAIAPGARASAFANDRAIAGRTGGQRLAEVIIYNRELTDQERRDTEAYLMHKWLNRSAPGYGAASAPLVAKVANAGGSLNIAVTGEGAAAISELSGAGDVTKTGSGTLALGNGTSGYAGVIQISEGAVSSLNNSGATPASSPLFHVDASQTNTFTFVEENGTNFIASWKSIGFENNAAVASIVFPKRPYLLTNDLAKLPVVDFGAYGTAGACLQWSNRLTNIRTVFTVLGSQRGGGFILGDTGGANFHRGGANIDNGIVAGNVMFGYDWSVNVQNGKVYLDSNYIPTPTGQSLNGGWQLIEIQTAGPTAANLFAGDRNSANRLGGQRLAEVIIYDRLLSETERVQTENYLNKKWFGKTPAGAGLGTLIVQNGTGVKADTVPMTVNALLGDADIIKSGDQMVTLKNTTSFTGIVEVTQGTLNLAVPAAPLSPPTNTMFWVDASRPGTMRFDASGAVTNWSDVTGNGRYAYPTAAGRAPTLRGTDFAGLPVMDMGPYGTAAGKSMYWNQQITGMKTIIWVLGSQASGGYLLGNTGTPTFHRGPPPEGGGILVSTMSYRNYMFAWDAIRPTNAYVDRTIVDPWTTGLSGNYQILIFTYNAGNYADGFAFDRAFGDRHGGQRLAEFMAYNRVLTTDEIAAADAYLRAKWFGVVNPGYALPSTDTGVILHENTLLTMNGTEQRVTTLAGSGSVSNGTLVVTERLSPGMTTGDIAEIPVSGNLTLSTGAVYEMDYSSPQSDRVTVSGTLALGSSGTMTVRVSGPVVLGQFAVLTYASITGAENLSAWTVNGLPGGYTGKLVDENGVVYLAIRSAGTMISVM
jgi:autotransporter-associated beta strand protein